MEIILQQDYPVLGYIGDKMKVKPGYARNFLIPNGIAIEASSNNAKVIAHKIACINALKSKKRVEAVDLQKNLEAVVLEYTLKQASKSKGYGSISVKDIEKSLKEKGFVIQPSQLKLNETIKTAGEYKASVKLHSEVTAEVPVKVVFETAQAPVKESTKE